MKNKLNPRFSDISLTYVLFISLVIVPNLILGIFGFLTLRAHESDVESNYTRAYEIIMNTLIDDVNDKIQEEDEQLKFILKSFPKQDINKILQSIMSKTNSFDQIVYIDKLGNFTFRDEVSEQAQKAFEEKYRGSLLVRIKDFSGNYPTRLIVESSDDEKSETFYCIELDSSNSVFNHGFIAIKYDQQLIINRLVNPKFKKFNIENEVSLKLTQNNKDFIDDSSIALNVYWEGNIFPYWKVILEYTQSYLDNRASTSSIFLILFGLLLPFVGAALIGLRMKLLREMRVAHLKTDFISRVSHELRTPLTSIRMFSEMLDMESIPEAQKKNCIDVIQREADRLTKLVNRVLNFSKLESRNKVFTFENTDIEKLVVETVRFFEKQIPNKDFKIKLLKDPRVREVTIDKDGIREILLNLIENSYKYSSDDKEITVKIQKIENDLRIIVIDNGFGIPREDLNRVFQKFYRVDDQINRAIDGTGLGLSICMDIAKAHGGDIQVESERGAGSKFIVSLPLKFKPAQWAKYRVTKKYPWQ